MGREAAAEQEPGDTGMGGQGQRRRSHGEGRAVPGSWWWPPQFSASNGVIKSHRETTRGEADTLVYSLYTTLRWGPGDSMAPHRTDGVRSSEAGISRNSFLRLGYAEHPNPSQCGSQQCRSHQQVNQAMEQHPRYPKSKEVGLRGWGMWWCSHRTRGRWYIPRLKQPSKCSKPIPNQNLLKFIEVGLEPMGRT